MAPEAAQGLQKAFLMGAAQQAAVSELDQKAVIAGAAAAAKASFARETAVAKAHQKTIDALAKAKAVSSKATFNANHAFLSKQYENEYTLLNEKSGYTTPERQELAKTNLANIQNGLHALNQSYSEYQSTLESKDPTDLPDYDFNSNPYVQIPATPPEIGLIPATGLARDQAGLSKTNIQIGNLLHPPDTGKISPREKAATKANDDLMTDIGGVNKRLDIFNSKYIKNANPAQQQALRQDAGALLNSYRDVYNNASMGKYDQANPMFSNVAKTVQQVLGARWNHPAYANEQVDVLNRYFLANPNADANSKKAAKTLHDAIMERAPQLQSIAPYFQQVEQAPSLGAPTQQFAPPTTSPMPSADPYPSDGGDDQEEDQ